MIINWLKAKLTIAQGIALGNGRSPISSPCRGERFGDINAPTGLRYLMHLFTQGDALGYCKSGFQPEKI